MLAKRMRFVGISLVGVSAACFTLACRPARDLISRRAQLSL
jgi:hypothetical protein